MELVSLWARVISDICFERLSFLENLDFFGFLPVRRGLEFAGTERNREGPALATLRGSQ